MLARLLAILLAGLACGCGGCASVRRYPVRAATAPVLLNWCPTDWTRTAAAAWEREAVARYGPDIVLVCCHGDADVRPWQLDPDAAVMPPQSINAVAWTLHAAFPGRRIVFCSCNPFHEKLTVPHCSYAPTNVWIVPGDDVRPFTGDPPGVGDISEFIDTPER